MLYGREAYYHHIIHKRHAGGLVADLQTLSPDSFRIHSLNHRAYFEEYLMDGEDPNRLVSAVKTVAEYERPKEKYYCYLRSVPYLNGINSLSLSELGDNVNKIFVIFERFGEKGDLRKNGHFMLLWQNRKSKDNGKFTLFDPFGRIRPNDPEQYYTLFNKGLDFQMPTSQTCALWCIYALVKYCLGFPASFKSIEPVEYDGLEATLDKPWFLTAYRQQFSRNEQFLYSTLVKNWIIFLPKTYKPRPMFENAPAFQPEETTTTL